MTPVRLEPAALRSRVKHSTTEPLRSLTFVAIGTLRVKYVVKNNEVPDKLASEKPADLDLHCFQNGVCLCSGW